MIWLNSDVHVISFLHVDLTLMHASYQDAYIL